MKKNYLFGLFAMATMLFTASCQEENIAGINDDNSDVVTFAVNMKQNAATRAELAGRGVQADSLYYGVYEKIENGWSLIPAISAAQEEGQQFAADISSGNVNVEIKLAKQKLYSVIFWATNEANDVCNVDWANRTMTMKATGATANNEANDAFWAYETVTLNGAVAKTVDLYRPFAQLNIGASKDDFEAAHAAQVDVETSQIVLKKVANTFDMETGAASGEADVELTYAYNAIPNSTAWRFPIEGHDYLAFGYVLVGTNKSLVDVELSYKDTKGGNYASTFTSVPVQRNYRTNIYGNLLSNSADYNVNLKPELGDGDNNVLVQDVATAEELVEAIKNMEDLEDGVELSIVLKDDIDLNDLLGSSNAPATRAAADPSLTIKAGKELSLDLNGKKLVATSKQTGSNYNMFDVRGTLTVKNGTMEYKHEGNNMGWNNSTNLFNITAGGVLNLDGVTAKNLGGSDMAFVAHLNNWGEATLNIVNSTLESTYIAVRVFNSGNDMNNVAIEKSTLKGKYCFWVHNYKAAGDAAGTDETLNFNIYGNDNTFEYTGKAPVLYGFANPIYYDANGNELADALQAAINAAEGETTIVLRADIIGNVTVVQKPGVKITIDGNGKKFNGSIKVHSNSNHYADAALTIKNVNFEVSVASVNVIEALENGAERYSTNITVEGCTFTATGEAVNTSVGVQIKSSKNAKVLNCTATDMHSLIQAQSCDETVVVKDCTINGKNGVAFKQVKAATVEGTTITALEYGIRFDGNTDNYGIVVKNNNVTAVQPLIVRKMTGKNNTIALEGVNTFITEADYQIVITNDSDDKPYVKPTGTYTLTGADEYVVYPLNMVVASSEELAAAVKAGATKLRLKAGEYNVANCGGKTLEINGSKDAIIMIYNEGEDGADYGFDGSTVTFNGVTINTSKNTGSYKGFARMNATFNYCDFIGAYCSFHAQSFNNCTFDFKNGYFWTWGATALTFDACEFNGNSKCILAHGSAATTININDCSFNASEKGYTGAGDNTAVVEMDPIANNRYTVNFTGNNTKTEHYAGWYRVKDETTGHTVTGIN